VSRNSAVLREVVGFQVGELRGRGRFVFEEEERGIVGQGAAVGAAGGVEDLVQEFPPLGL
jgi:hypothetical protein